MRPVAWSARQWPSWSQHHSRLSEIGSASEHHVEPHGRGREIQASFAHSAPSIWATPRHPRPRFGVAISYGQQIPSFVSNEDN